MKAAAAAEMARAAVRGDACGDGRSIEDEGRTDAPCMDATAWRRSPAAAPGEETATQATTSEGG